jgi:glycerol-3-phosphate O-acyltransferase / dihydroxyacetone phosphate acyltransferase
MFYRAFRALASLTLRLFFRIEAPVDPTDALKLEGPVMFVGNHPNGLIDPGIMLILAKRKVTFLAKEPLFRMPVLGLIMRGMDALPIFRKQDGPGDTSKNEGTLVASVDALVQGRAITLFPEGKSHSEPQLAELKTGAARIALEATRKGAQVKLVPVGITYEAKNRFKSRVHVEVARALPAAEFLERAGEDPHEAARRFTDAIAASLRQVTLNLDAWEDLPILETAEQLYALSQGEKVGSAERQKAFARGMALLRDEQPERYERLKNQLAAYRARLALLAISPDDLSSQFRPRTVAFFILRNLFAVLSAPLVLIGFGLFVIPYHLPLLAVKAARPEEDTESTVKVLTLLLLAPVWWALLTGLAWWTGGFGFAVSTFFAVPPLALFTRYYLERRAAAAHDARTFFVLLSRGRLKAALQAEGRALAAEVEGLVNELTPRLAS